MKMAITGEELRDLIKNYLTGSDLKVLNMTYEMVCDIEGEKIVIGPENIKFCHIKGVSIGDDFDHKEDEGDF
jgi:hypothetical protein